VLRGEGNCPERGRGTVWVKDIRGGNVQGKVLQSEQARQIGPFAAYTCTTLAVWTVHYTEHFVYGGLEVSAIFVVIFHRCRCIRLFALVNKLTSWCGASLMLLVSVFLVLRPCLSRSAIARLGYRWLACPSVTCWQCSKIRIFTFFSKFKKARFFTFSWNDTSKTRRISNQAEYR